MNESIIIQEGMTYRQVQQAIGTGWPLLTIVLFHPTQAFYKEDRFAKDAFVEPSYVLRKRVLTTDPIRVSGDMSEHTLQKLLYKTYTMESSIAYRNNPYGGYVPGATLDQMQETVQRWWREFEATNGRPPGANDEFKPA